MSGLMSMFSPAPPEGAARALAPTRQGQGGRHQAASAQGRAPQGARRVQKTYEPVPLPPPPQQQDYNDREDDEDPASDQEENASVDAERRIQDMTQRKDEYTKVYQAQWAMLNDLEVAIGGNTEQQQDENIAAERDKINQQRIAIRNQYVRLMVQCAAVASDYGKMSPAPFLPEPSRVSSSRLGAPVAPVKQYSYHRSGPAPTPAPAPTQSTPAAARVAPAYIPGPPAPLDMTQYEVQGASKPMSLQ